MWYHKYRYHRYDTILRSYWYFTSKRSILILIGHMSHMTDTWFLGIFVLDLGCFVLGFFYTFIQHMNSLTSADFEALWYCIVSYHIDIFKKVLNIVSKLNFKYPPQNFDLWGLVLQWCIEITQINFIVKVVSFNCGIQLFFMSCLMLGSKRDHGT